MLELRSQAIVCICDDTVRFESVSAEYAFRFAAIGHCPAASVTEEQERMFFLVIYSLLLYKRLRHV